MFDGAFEVRFPAGRIAEEFRNDLLPAERRERQRRDKLPRAASHHHLHAEPVLLQTAHEFPSFISRHSRSEEHTSELQSHLNIVCRLLLEKKKERRSTPTQPLGREHTSHARPPM